MQVAFPRAPSRLIVLLALLSSCGGALPEHARVRRVIHGDTLELRDGRLVRYLGIDTPEVRRKDGERWVVAPEPFAEAATEANRRLVEGKIVRLAYDVQTHDRVGRLLAYVYVPDGAGEVMVNAELVRQGFAQPLTIPPNVRHAQVFRALAEEARVLRRGLWGDDECPERVEGCDGRGKGAGGGRANSDPLRGR